MNVIKDYLEESKNIVFYDMKKNKKHNAIRKKIGTSIITIILTASTLMTSVLASFELQKESKDLSLVEEPSITRLFIDESYLQEESNERLNEAIRKNKNLNDYQKGILAQFAPFINDNPYVDEHNFKNFETVKIVDNNGLNDLGYEVPSFIMGYCFPDKNVVWASDVVSYTIYHELFHSFSILDSKTTGISSYSQELNEGITQILTESYAPLNYSEEIKQQRYANYYAEKCFASIVIELIGKDKVLEAYTKGNHEIILNELSKYTDGFEDIANGYSARVFLGRLHDCIYFNNLNFSTEQQQSLHQATEKAEKFLRYAYEKKFGQTQKYEDDFLMKMYFHGATGGRLIDIVSDKYYIFDFDIFKQFNDKYSNNVTVSASNLKDDNDVNSKWDFKEVGTYSLDDIRFSLSGKTIKEKLTDFVSKLEQKQEFFSNVSESKSDVTASLEQTKIK